MEVVRMNCLVVAFVSRSSYLYYSRSSSIPWLKPKLKREQEMEIEREHCKLQVNSYVDDEELARRVGGAIFNSWYQITRTKWSSATLRLEFVFEFVFELELDLELKLNKSLSLSLRQLWRAAYERRRIIERWTRIGIQQPVVESSLSIFSLFIALSLSFVASTLDLPI